MEFSSKHYRDSIKCGSYRLRELSPAAKSNQAKGSRDLEPTSMTIHSLVAGKMSHIVKSTMYIRHFSCNYRDRLKGSYVVAINLFLLLLNGSAWPCLAVA